MKMKLWSYSTTVRNPERIRSFLKVLKLMEGEIWSHENQKKFQVLLIQNRVYGYGEPQFHNTLSKKHNSWLDSDSLTYEQAEIILDVKNYEGGGDMRGRQSYNPLKKMGLTYINEERKIIITSFGNLFLDNNYDLGDVFFKSFIKWQYPSPDSNDYNNHKIKPFIATLHLISKVNELSRALGLKEKGVSRDEFALFFTTLSDYNDIEQTAEKIIDFRFYINKNSKGKDKNTIYEDFFNKNFPEFDSWSNAKEYTDNIIRYFRLTRYIYIRGNGFYIDLEPRRILEINELLKFDDASPLSFKNSIEYYNYLGDANRLQLPWEKKSILNKVKSNLIKELKSKFDELNKLEIDLPPFPSYDNEINEINLLKKQISDLRDYRRKLNERETHFYSKSIDKLNEYTNNLLNIDSNSRSRPIELERYVTLGLNALNDAIEIKPNYPVGDDNEPTFTAPANKPDIECYYNKFNAICEVTMLKNRSQWYNEGQPVMRHIRDFEEINREKETYCLFIAPLLHRDTINTFWYSVKYEYEGKKQKIIPLTINQFVGLLNTLKTIKQEGGFLKHDEIKELYDLIINNTENLQSSDEWINSIPNIICKWENSLLRQ